MLDLTSKVPARYIGIVSAPCSGMKSLSSADVAASKGHAPPIDPRLVVKDVMGRPVGVWSGKVVSK